MFPITYYRGERRRRGSRRAAARPHYFDIGDHRLQGQCRRPHAVADRRRAAARRSAHGTQRLLDMAVVIRSKDAGINRLTFDIIFTSAEQLRGGAALERLPRATTSPRSRLPRRARRRHLLRRQLQRDQDLDRPAEHLGVDRRARRLRRAAAGRDRAPQHSDLRGGTRQGIVLLRRFNNQPGSRDWRSDDGFADRAAQDQGPAVLPSGLIRTASLQSRECDASRQT